MAARARPTTYRAGAGRPFDLALGVVRAGRLFEAATVADIARVVDLPEATVRDVLAALVAEGWLTRSKAGSRIYSFDVGPRLRSAVREISATESEVEAWVAALDAAIGSDDGAEVQRLLAEPWREGDDDGQEQS